MSPGMQWLFWAALVWCSIFGALFVAALLWLRIQRRAEERRQQQTLGDEHSSPSTWGSQ